MWGLDWYRGGLVHRRGPLSWKENWGRPRNAVDQQARADAGNVDDRGHCTYSKRAIPSLTGVAALQHWITSLASRAAADECGVPNVPILLLACAHPRPVISSCHAIPYHRDRSTQGILSFPHDTSFPLCTGSLVSP